MHGVNGVMLCSFRAMSGVVCLSVVFRPPSLSGTGRIKFMGCPATPTLFRLLEYYRCMRVETG